MINQYIGGQMLQPCCFIGGDSMSVAFYDFFKIYANEKDIGLIRIGLRACTIYIEMPR